MADCSKTYLHVDPSTEGRPAEAAGRLSEPDVGDRSTIRALSVGLAMATVPILYLLFVVHYSRNALFEDDWSVVLLVHSALHGRLTWGALWAQHHQDRMFIPNLIFVGLGALTHDNAQVVIVLSAVIFVATFFVFVATFRSYLRRPLTPLVVLLLGFVWFSVEDWHNSLWAFQLPWYVSVFCLVAMIYLLAVPQRRNLIFACAVAASFIASFCCFQGLALWPVGLICLVWTLRGDPHHWERRRRAELLVWLGATIVTVATYFWHYSFGQSSCSAKGTLLFNCASESTGFALHHPIRTVQFFLVELGEIIPNSNGTTLWLNGALGAVLLAAAGLVVVQSIRHRDNQRNCLPVALIAFGILFDIFIAVGRVGYGLVALAPQSSYTMPNLLILAAVVAYAIVHLQFEPGRARTWASRVLIVGGTAFLAIQLAATTDSGIAHARTWDQHLVTGARLVVNLNDIPPRERGCYSFYGVFVYLYPVPDLKYPGFAEAREDHLSIFSPSLLRQYRADGLPNIPQCRSS